MKQVRERLSKYTTLKVGGYAQIVEISSEMELQAFFEHNANGSWYVLGGGSNVLAPDEGFEGVVLLMRIPGITLRSVGTEETVYIDAGAGVDWNELVSFSTQEGLWGLENLTDIPGTVGASPVQNIGAYGVEVKDSIVSVRAYDTHTNTFINLSNTECCFEYRNSLFKRTRRYVVTGVTFKLTKKHSPNLAYKDLQERGVYADTNSPRGISEMVHEIRSEKFPDIHKEGTAGSFFKNPMLSLLEYNTLQEKYAGIPAYSVSEDVVKIPLAYILDKILALRGFQKGHVRCFEKQPLVIVTTEGVTATDIDLFAREIEKKVFDATQIVIEREVQQIK